MLCVMKKVQGEFFQVNKTKHGKGQCSRVKVKDLT